jgi:hypothetical protein
MREKLRNQADTKVTWSVLSAGKVVINIVKKKINSPSQRL